MSDYLAISDNLSELLWKAVDFAAQQVKKGHRPFLPFVLMEGAAGDEMVVLGAIDGSEVQAEGLRVIGERNPSCAILCYDGFITLSGARKDAIYAIGCERGIPQANIFARPYRFGGLLGSSLKLEDLGRYGVIENPIALD